jgi:H+/gluconate symporter-like permease
MEYAGLLGSVVLLIWLALRGIDIILAALLCSLLVIVTNGLPQAVVLLTITQLSHRDAYRDLGMITVVIPVATTLILIGNISLVSCRSGYRRGRGSKAFDTIGHSARAGLSER